MSKNAENYDCIICELECVNEIKYNKHILTRAHINRTELIKKKPKNAKIYDCIICDFRCCKQSNFNLHLLTKKHISLTQQASNIRQYSCKNCKKKYKARNSLWYHEQKCSNINISNTDNVHFGIVNDENTIIENITIDIEEVSQKDLDLKTLILEVIKNNSELQKQNSELQKQMIEVCKNSNNTNNTIINNNNNNKTFNLNFFLNEQCKDAMNISEFVNTFDLQLEDLESVGELGYVEGMTKIIVDKLNSMDIYKRPMHCSDAKREIIYIKDENIWAREERNNPKLRQAIKTVTFRNMKQVKKWSDKHPESLNNESHLNDKYMMLVIQSTGGNGLIGDSENKIIRRIVKEIVIGKNLL